MPPDDWLCLSIFTECGVSNAWQGVVQLPFAVMQSRHLQGFQIWRVAADQ